MQQRRSATSYTMFAFLAAATLTVVALGWVVARDFRQSAEAANQLYDRFGEGLDLIDDTHVGCQPSAGICRSVPLGRKPRQTAARESLADPLDRPDASRARVRLRGLDRIPPDAR
jgi:hypothetical protein